MTDSDKQTAPPQLPVGRPVPSSPVHGADVLGLRIVAALIDLAILTAVFVVLAATIGELDLTGDAASVTLNGVPALLYVSLAFLYYFGFEAATGRTVGKLLVGLQVVGNDWTHPSAGHVAVRTVLRAVDGLPAFYLVGFVAMLATGRKRQRLGDLAAGTIVLRAAPIRHRVRVVVLLAVAQVGAVVLPFATLGEASTTYRAHGVAFQYPAGWQDRTPNASGNRPSDMLWTAVLSIDQTNGTVVSAYRVPTSVSAENLDAVMAENTRYFQETFESAGGSMGAGPEKVTVTGLPSLRYQGHFLTEDGTRVESTIVQAFDGTTEYFFSCEYTRVHAAEMAQGCEQILSTFTLESASERDAART